MIALFLILFAFGSTLAQSTSLATANTTTASPVTTTSLSTLLSTSLSMTSSANVMTSTLKTVTSMGPPENCSVCLETFQRIYLNSTDDSEKCPPIVDFNGSCVSYVRTDNCSDIVSLLYSSANSNLSFGLACTVNGFRVVKWTSNCTVDSEMLRSINESNDDFCRMGGFNCSVDSLGIHRIHKFTALEPFRKRNYCIPPTTSRPTIPLLPNPVGPSAITAIVVLVCLFITAVLAGFFFWPKCHMSKPPPAKKKPPQAPVEAFNVVAYSAASRSPTGAANATITLSPNQIGPAA